MGLYFYKSNNGSWGVSFSTSQSEMPAILEQMIKDAVKVAVGKFNKK